MLGLDQPTPALPDTAPETLIQTELTPHSCHALWGRDVNFAELDIISPVFLRRGDQPLSNPARLVNRYLEDLSNDRAQQIRRYLSPDWDEIVQQFALMSNKPSTLQIIQPDLVARLAVTLAWLAQHRNQQYTKKCEQYNDDIEELMSEQEAAQAAARQNDLNQGDLQRQIDEGTAKYETLQKQARTVYNQCRRIQAAQSAATEKQYRANDPATMNPDSFGRQQPPPPPPAQATQSSPFQDGNLPQFMNRGTPQDKHQIPEFQRAPKPPPTFLPTDYVFESGLTVSLDSYLGSICDAYDRMDNWGNTESRGNYAPKFDGSDSQAQFAAWMDKMIAHFKQNGRQYQHEENRADAVFNNVSGTARTILLHVQGYGCRFKRLFECLYTLHTHFGDSNPWTTANTNLAMLEFPRFPDGNKTSLQAWSDFDIQFSSLTSTLGYGPQQWWADFWKRIPTGCRNTLSTFAFNNTPAAMIQVRNMCATYFRNADLTATVKS
ncbi:hypothetical protein HBH98_241580 [Parastagonospora nodorum]|nr:hypothetical protein HBH53_246420 [Parastagonospora nodorum]KAH3956602.1 hypothetical protein HBH51_238710 [Parastagonospora nodorum]KAH4215598.1 hypothetical protein HBI06_246140 [Parastagonospora nodorum]KAH4224350.1 hypothetical protein HBI05_239190 [Parastagonospora nodorum]KAH4334391.1 hypothetical protein HBH98_241580 [Parastagonospora nodorum]